MAEAPERRTVAAMGAPEDIAALCRLSVAERAKLAPTVEDMAASGLRVLGVARAEFSGSNLPELQGDSDFAFLVHVGLADPIRDDVPAAVAERLGAGVRVVMITGDFPATALAIAQQAAIEGEPCLTGREIEGLDDEALAARVRKTSVFARHNARSEAAPLGGSEGKWRDWRHDRPWRERCAFVESRGYRGRHGRSWRGCRARGLIDRVARRRLRLDRQDGPAGTAH